MGHSDAPGICPALRNAGLYAESPGDVTSQNLDQGNALVLHLDRHAERFLRARYRRGIKFAPAVSGRSGVVHVTHCELESPPKMCFRSAERRCSRRHVHEGHPGRDRYGGYDVRLTYSSFKPSSRASADLSGISVSAPLKR